MSIFVQVCGEIPAPPLSISFSALFSTYTEVLELFNLQISFQCDLRLGRVSLIAMKS